MEFDLNKRYCYYFNELAKIPRGSRNEKAASDWVCEFAKAHGLTYKQDHVWNVYVEKPATPGYENADPLILAIMEALLDKKHGGEIPKVLHTFVGLALEEEKIGVAEVTSAVELSDADKDKVRTRLLDTTAYETMRVSFAVDPSLIGGMIIKLKDKVVDSSLKTKLGHMKNSLLTGA